MTDARPAAQLFLDRARELTEFCLRRGASRTGHHAFAGWKVETLFAYVFFHVVARTVFVLRQGGTLSAVAFAWSKPEQQIRWCAAAGVSPFQWRKTDDQADSILLGEVIAPGVGLAGWRRLWKQGRERWPDLDRRKVFTYRAGRLVEITAAVQRMTQRS